MLAAVVIITGAHAVMLVLSQTAAYSMAGESSMITTVLTAIRVAFPLLVEMAENGETFYGRFAPDQAAAA